MKITKDSNLNNRRRSREREMITNATDGYISATEKYKRYFEGSPSYVTYFQLDLLESTQDQVLENTNDLFGEDSPKRYKQIEDVAMYGVNAVDIATELTDYGLTSELVGEAILLPGSIKPYVGDVFIFNNEAQLGQLSNIAFRVYDVQVDKASVQKFWRVQFKIENATVESIYDAVTVNEDGVREEYEVGSTGDNSLVHKSGIDVAYSALRLVDDMVRHYLDEYYDEDMDLLIDSTYDMWCPYLHKFLRNNKILEFNDRNIMEEIYLMNFSDKELTGIGIFDRKIYKKSLFRNLEVQSKKTNEGYDVFKPAAHEKMNQTHILPFFNVQDEYKKSQAFNGIFHDTTEYLLLPEAEMVPNLDKSTTDSEPFTYKEPMLIVGTDTNMQQVSIASRVKLDKPITEIGSSYDITIDDEYLLQNIVILYLNKRLELTDDLLDKLNNFDYDFDTSEYYLVPMVIYILKQLSKDILK